MDDLRELNTISIKSSTTHESIPLHGCRCSSRCSHDSCDRSNTRFWSSLYSEIKYMMLLCFTTTTVLQL